MEKVTVTKVMKSVIDELPEDYEFSGYDLKQMCCRKEPELSCHYVETFLKLMRKWRREKVVCINHNRSIYRKVGGANE